MFKGVKVYLHGGTTVVLNKADIHNAKDEDFQEVFMYLSHDFIRESVRELEFMEDIEDFIQEDEDF